jgi:RHS repeat-associated protein
MGNIMTLNRSGWQNTSNYINLDVLGYTYDSGNKLLSVTDTGNKTYGFKDGSFTGNDYSYDSNGNLITDKNKGITNITYDHFNAPTRIDVTTTEHNGNVQYTYDASGIKLKKTATDNGNVTTVEYNGNYVYENGVLKSITHPEGYIEQEDDGSFTYVYEHRDIWRNTRITYADNDKDGKIDLVHNGVDIDGDNDYHEEIRREQNYYPFGMQWENINSTIRNAKNNLKTFQGQELTEDLGLNTHEWRYRMSDRSIGRFWQVDPLAESYVYNSTYAFAENKLGLGVELEGAELLPFNVTDMFNFEGGGKPVLTLGLHNIVLPTADRSEDGAGTFIGNVAKSMWNGIAGTWNAGMQGENMGDMTTASLKEMGKTADRIAAGEGTQQDAENITAGIVLSVVKGKGGKGAGKIKQAGVTGHTKHGLNQSINRNGGRGVSAKAKAGAIVNPKSVTSQSGGRTKYKGKKATVITNSDGKIITTFGSSRSKTSVPQGRSQGGGKAQRRNIKRTGASYNPNQIK